MNFSLLQMEAGELPQLMEVCLLLIAKERTWTMTESIGDGEKKIVIKTINDLDWYQTLNQVIKQI
ncbi:hypothetical protein M3182_21465 [Mesobacillus maritimus]|uniref:hypothetical protein n=1 Tax=Mesobacillus maritimus TaxID=1643336 RepID=UPI00203D558F|nr:hypothetical protein [Mesobacillus maritimus]MCM3588276.1 hypothetical protein [Mesobacillus maritimus]